MRAIDALSKAAAAAQHQLYRRIAATASPASMLADKQRMSAKYRGAVSKAKQGHEKRQGGGRIGRNGVFKCANF